MKTKTSTFPLRLPVSLKSAVEKLAAEDGVSMNQFVTMAVAEKVSALNTVEFFAERKAQADRAAFRRILQPRRRRTTTLPGRVAVRGRGCFRLLLEEQFTTNDVADHVLHSVVAGP